MNIPQAILNKADMLESKAQSVCPQVAHMVKKCFLNTIETTVQDCGEGDYFVITGDIPAMWLRDSASQVRPYVSCCADSEEVRGIFRGIIHRHAAFVAHDSYANAFNKEYNPRSHKDDTDFSSELIWERKFEIDSLCASVYLLCDYYDVTKDGSVVNGETAAMLKAVYETFRTEQRHNEKSKYYFNRKNCRESDTLICGGRGRPAADFTGMLWSGFRPSDDSCYYHYSIPINMMAEKACRRAAGILEDNGREKELAENFTALADEIRGGIEKYGIMTDDDGSRYYTFETDGLGNYLFMDDANSPSLLSLPYFGYCAKDDALYLNTRKRILSKKNPYYYEGTAATGIGSPHTPDNYIWHIGLIMQALTSTDRAEQMKCIDMIAATDAGTGFMHESFNKDRPEEFTRSWFAWANSLFAQMIEEL